MKKLTVEEELKVLEELMADPEENFFIDNGSSRAVFQYGEDKVVKIAVDEGGMVQNKQEIEGFKLAPEICATIYAYGHNIIIMEAVDTCEEAMDMISDMLYDSDDPDMVVVDDDYYDTIDEDYDTTDAKERAELYNYACNFFGYTADNCQMGYAYTDGRLCLYDYGFRYLEDTDRNNQIGSIGFYLEDNSTKDLLEDVYATVESL